MKGQPRTCDECGGSGKVPAVAFVMALALSIRAVRKLRPTGEIACEACGGTGEAAGKPSSKPTE